MYAYVCKYLCIMSVCISLSVVDAETVAARSLRGVAAMFCDIVYCLIKSVDSVMSSLYSTYTFISSTSVIFWFTLYMPLSSHCFHPRRCNHLLCGEIKDAFASCQRLKQKCARMSVFMSVCLYVFVCLSVRLRVCLCVCLSVCTSPCLSV